MTVCTWEKHPRLSDGSVPPIVNTPYNRVCVVVITEIRTALEAIAGYPGDDLQPAKREEAIRALEAILTDLQPGKDPLEARDLIFAALKDTPF